jgi:hypothetical protein
MNRRNMSFFNRRNMTFFKLIKGHNLHNQLFLLKMMKHHNHLMQQEIKRLEIILINTKFKIQEIYLQMIPIYPKILLL